MSLLRRFLIFLRLIKPAPKKEEVRNAPAEIQQAFKITEQNVYTMVNTITFSTDMKKMYLIDNGRSIEFSLENRGVLVGALRGQISVATAFEFPKPENENDAGNTEGRTGTEIPMSTPLNTKKTVWSGVFHQQRRILCLIGATEIEIRKPGDTLTFDYQPSLHFFNIEDNTLHIRRRKDDIFVLSIPKDLKG
jgi:hypothetical protein